MKKGILSCIGLIAFMLIAVSCDNPASETPADATPAVTELGHNANLSALTINVGILNPSFSPEITEYQVDCYGETSSVTVTGTLADSKATISANNGVVQSLALGINDITLTVTAEDGETAKNYVIKVNRHGSSDPRLTSLTVSSGILRPPFSDTNLNYTMLVPEDTAEITVTGTPRSAFSVLSENNAVPQSLNVGTNEIVITVTAQSGSEYNYRVTIDRAGDYSSQNVGTLKYVPAGRFQRDSGGANVSVITKPYRMGKYEITRAQFRAVMGDEPLALYYTGDDDPVKDVSWYQAIAFCNKLSLLEGLTPVYAVTGVDFSSLGYDDIPTSRNSSWEDPTPTWENDGYRLPTDMEWMWAAMGAPFDGQDDGSNDPTATNSTGYLKGYAGSSEGSGTNNIGSYAWYDGNSESVTHPVGGKAANELGIYDMTGNAWEYCWDSFNSKYPSGTLIDYQGEYYIPGVSLPPPFERTYHGGGFDSGVENSRVSNRMRIEMYQGNSGTGFRVIRP